MKYELFNYYNQKYHNTNDITMSNKVYTTGSTDEILKSLTIGATHTKNEHTTQVYNANITCGKFYEKPFVGSSVSYENKNKNGAVKMELGGDVCTGILAKTTLSNNRVSVATGYNFGNENSIGFIADASVHINNNFTTGISQRGSNTELQTTLDSGKGHNFNSGISSDGFRIGFGFSM